MKLVILIVVFVSFQNIWAKDFWLTSAPVVSNGLTAAEPTELNVHFASPDPLVRGIDIPYGGYLSLSFLGSFERNGIDNDLEFVKVDSNKNFIATNGHPQNPIKSSRGDNIDQADYTILDSGHREIRIVANQPDGLQGSRYKRFGIKTLHLRPNASTGNGPGIFRNGAGDTLGRIYYKLVSVKGEILREGNVFHYFKVQTGPQVFVTNVGIVSGQYDLESTNYQTVRPLTSLTKTNRNDTSLAFAPRFLLFSSAQEQPDSYIPHKGIENVSYDVNANDQTNAVIKHNGKVIGRVDFITPEKKGDHSEARILSSQVLTSSGDGVTGANGSVFLVPVKVGTEPGVYKVLIKLYDGNEAVNTIKVR
ncbi:MAG: hypothetical protein COW01_03705 [Bdellovibrionales bacterium CG12_big_fil_rev_8_21_14_0_65_38_15]|nr:MAG: hypothetical protein COW79_02570 [Bdellovibrionales bacterium CG22_combo_CG10-13_8_21_14_all_38_13]PIQ56722.1 MAG: hypothetical protein COW01_03705 [Bdellovibrionales bacterium CG12_big_fil_rev_8_21_14_0_65_38_15]PIR31050.1 MAG: hypothetical protein COV38_02595 [Bdellovibrionales bacterium CG11_big_fil_rev_8_21_14_0_20_38_13]